MADAVARRLARAARRAAASSPAPTTGSPSIDLDAGRFEIVANPEADLPGQPLQRRQGRPRRAASGRERWTIRERQATRHALSRRSRPAAGTRSTSGYRVTNGPAFSPDGRPHVPQRYRRGRSPTRSTSTTTGNAAQPPHLPPVRRRRRLSRRNDGRCRRLPVDRLLGRLVRPPLFARRASWLETIEMPVQRPTSCAFGGPDLDRLYITSASIGLDASGARDATKCRGVVYGHSGGAGASPTSPLRADERRRPRRLSHRQLHVRDRDREQHPDDQPRQDPHRRDGGLRPLRALARGLRLRPGNRHQFPALRPAAPQDLPRARQVRLGVRRPHLRRAEAARDHADRRPVPLRRARLDRQFPEPRFPAAVRRLCRRVRRALPVGPALHADQRDVHLRGLLGEIRLVERAEEGRPLVRHRAQAHRQSQCHGDDRDPQAPPRRDLHPVGIVGILSRRFSPAAIGRAEVLNQMRFLSLDLNYGRRVDSGMYQYPAR